VWVLELAQHHPLAAAVVDALYQQQPAHEAVAESDKLASPKFASSTVVSRFGWEGFPVFSGSERANWFVLFR
jgi:cation transport ATPase